MSSLHVHRSVPYIGQVTFYKVPENTVMFMRSPCISTSHRVRKGAGQVHSTRRSIYQHHRGLEGVGSGVFNTTFYITEGWKGAGQLHLTRLYILPSQRVGRGRVRSIQHDFTYYHLRGLEGGGSGPFNTTFYINITQGWKGAGQVHSSRRSISTSQRFGRGLGVRSIQHDILYQHHRGLEGVGFR